MVMHMQKYKNGGLKWQTPAELAVKSGIWQPASINWSAVKIDNRFEEEQ